MSDRAAVALAAAIALGAHVGGGPTPVLGALLAVVAVLTRRPWLLCLAAALLAAGLADRARAGLDPVGAGPFGPAWVTLAGDPVPLDSGGIRVDRGRRPTPRGRGPRPAGVGARGAAGGERVGVTGGCGGHRPPHQAAGATVVGRLEVDDVVERAPGPRLAGGANAIRRILAHGAEELPRTNRSLLAGVVLGDDREQPPKWPTTSRRRG